MGRLFQRLSISRLGIGSDKEGCRVAGSGTSDKRKGPRLPESLIGYGIPLRIQTIRLAAGWSCCRFFLLFFGDDRFCSEKESCDRGGKLESAADDFRRVHDPFFNHIDVDVFAGVVAFEGLIEATFWTTIDPSLPAFSAIWRSG